MTRFYVTVDPMSSDLMDLATPPQVIADDVDKPNGLAFSPDKRKLHAEDSGAVRGASGSGIDDDLPHQIRVFDVDGTMPSGGKVASVVAPAVPDGLSVDHQGFVRAQALDGIHCLSPKGALIGKIRPPAQISNLCFGGPDGTTIFITASDKVYRVASTRCDAAHVRPAISESLA